MDAPDSLDDTNKLLHDLERKLSFVLTTSLNQTTQLHGSVVQNPSMAGLARRNIQLSVLLYIRDNGSEFDTDLVYADRQQKFMTKFAREYSPSVVNNNPAEVQSGAQQNGISGGKSLSGPLISENDNLESLRTKSVALEVKQSSPAAVSLRASIEDDASEEYASDHEYASDTYDDYYDGEFDSGEDDYGDDDFENEFSDFSAQQYDNSDDESAEDMLLPPLPPRLPPRELDPDKLYGLYDFLGPDPLHCTLSRDEPVYLINDLDNYWWLIRKMSKTERMQLWSKRGSKENIASDDEDGKIGFVPAECLETYAERLARLNCHKNEELEKSSRETLPLDYYKDSFGDLLSHAESKSDLNRSGSLESNNISRSNSELRAGGETMLPSDSNVSSETQDITKESNSTEILKSSAEALPLGRKSSILKKSRQYRQSNKLVTFENLGDISLNDDDSEDIDFSHHYFHVDEIKPSGYSDDHEKHSEVLSDVFPAEVPLQVTKSTRKLASPDDNLGDSASLFVRPKTLAATETDSIGSFSPDTPPVGQFQSPREDFGSSNIRRSQILDRLTRVTSDIQEQLEGDRELGEQANLNFRGSLGENNGANYYKQSHREKVDYTNEFGTEFRNPYENELDGSGLAEDEHKSESESDTPLTSMNSLSNLASSPQTAIQEKRKSKPVHDMFMPILGKLDELTEKLAELEQHLL